MPIDVLIAEDDALLRDLLTRTLAVQDDIRVLGAIGNGGDVWAAVSDLKPAILLLDLHMPELPGLKVLERLGRMAEPPRVIVVSGDEANETQLEAARLGARGFVCKSRAATTLVEAIRVVAAGGVWFAPPVVSLMLNEYPALVEEHRQQRRPIGQLTEREHEILIRVARGMTNRQIAEDLFLSVSTVKVHVRHIFEKLKLSNRMEAALFAVREGLVEAEAAKQALV